MTAFAMVRKGHGVGVFRKKVKLPETLFVSMNGADGVRSIPGIALRAIGTHLANFGWTPDSGPTSEKRPSYGYGKRTESGHPVHLVYRIGSVPRSPFVVVKVAISGKREIPPEYVTVLKGSLAAAISAVEETGHRIAS
jgi:hypothetical protein